MLGFTHYIQKVYARLYINRLYNRDKTWAAGTRPSNKSFYSLFEKHTSQYRRRMKLGQYILGLKINW